MLTEQKDILIKKRHLQNGFGKDTEKCKCPPDEDAIQKEDTDLILRFHVMQSLHHNKWVLAAVKGVFEEYQVTEIMSANAWLMVSYARYLNSGVREPGIEQRQIELLDALKEEYRKKFTEVHL